MQCILKLQTTALFAGLGTPYNTDKGLNMVAVITRINCAYYCLSTSTNTVWNSSCEESRQLADYAKSLVKIVKKFGGIQLMF